MGGGNNYGANFEKWFNDRFFGREELHFINSKLVSINSVLENKIFFYDKKSNWIFHKGNFGAKITEENKRKILQELENMNSFLMANNIKFYLFIVPNKTDVYLDKHPLFHQAHSKLYFDYIDYFQNNATFDVIYPVNELKIASEKNFTYFKRSHHWTEYGAFIGYNSIISTLKKSFSNIDHIKEDNYKIFYDFRVRDDWERNFKDNDSIPLLGIKINEKEKINEKYKYYDSKQNIELKIEADAFNKIKYYKNKYSSNDLKVILTGTSNNENLLQFLPYSFSELKYFRFNSMKGIKPGADEYKFIKRYKDEVLKFKPDILVLSIVADNIPNLLYLTKE